MTNYSKWDAIARTIQDDGTIAPVIDPKDISVTFGKPMTEAEFLAHRASQGLPPTVIRPTSEACRAKATSETSKDKLRTKIQAMSQSRTAQKK